LIPALAKQAVYFAKAPEFAAPPNPPERGAVLIDGLGVDVVAALAGTTLSPIHVRAMSARADFFTVRDELKVMKKG
jgi:hypothetical protein